MSHRRIVSAALLVAAALPVSAASAQPVDLRGIHHRATTADIERPAPPPARDSFPWIEVAGFAGLVAVAGAGTARRRRRVA